MESVKKIATNKIVNIFYLISNLINIILIFVFATSKYFGQLSSFVIYSLIVVMILNSITMIYFGKLTDLTNSETSKKKSFGAYISLVLLIPVFIFLFLSTFGII